MADSSHLLCGLLRPLFVVSNDPEIDETGEGRIIEGVPELDLLSVKTHEIVILCPENAVVVGVEGLDDHLPKRFSSSCPACNLGQQLKGSLARSEIRKMEGGIRRYDADEGHIWKVVAFDDHLRSHQDVGMAVFQFFQDLVMGAPPGRRIPVHSSHLRSGEQGPDLLFKAFGADANAPEPIAPAIGAVSRRLDLVVAVMALEGAVLQVMGEGHAAVGAFKGEAAIRAENEMGESPPVEERGGSVSFLPHSFEGRL